MKTAHRYSLVGLVVALMLVFGACGDDNNGESSPTTVFQPTATTASPGSPTTGVATPTSDASGLIRGVTDGAVCTQQGARGVTTGGQNVVCGNIEGQQRWRPA